MIKYKLVCKNCNNFFDSWFASSKEYEKLKNLKHIICDNCNSLKVEKTLMTPSMLNSKKEKPVILKNKKYTKIKNTIKKYQKFIKIILSMLVKILLTRLVQFTTIIKKNQKVFMVTLQLKKLKN